MSEADFEQYALAIANSVKFASWDEETLKSDAGWEVYTHNLKVPEKVTIQGQECEVKMVTSQCFPLAQVEFNDGDLQYTMNTDRLSYNNFGIIQRRRLMNSIRQLSQDMMHISSSVLVLH